MMRRYLLAGAALAWVSALLAQQQQPSVVNGGVLNSASFAKDANGLGLPVAPGSLVSIFGSFPGATGAVADTVPFSTSLGGVSVTFDGFPAAMDAVFPTGPFPNIIVQVPIELTRANPNLVITVNSVSSTPVSTPIAFAAPGIFTSPEGQGNAIFVFADPADGIVKVAAPASSGNLFSIPVAPIPRGTSGLFYATGLGFLSPSVPDGAAGDGKTVNYAVLTPTVLVGGITAPLTYAIQAPGYVGINQLDITIPQSAPTGNAIPLQIMTADGSFTSTAGATIAIR